MSLVLASYNIHRCYGRDGRYEPQRIRQVLRELNAQVIALQEVELLHEAPGLLDSFCEDSHWQAIRGLTLTRETGHYGNALLTSLPVLSVQRIDLSMPGREPRGALYVTLEHENKPITVIATHLGLRPAERRAQIRRLLSVLQSTEGIAEQSAVTVLMGDLNEWFLWGRPLRWLRRYFQPSPAPASYPACCPLFALDRVWVKPAKKILSVRTVNNNLTRSASDHLPLLAQVE
jgi:endonuclease/exonuclease/phosphatase family metal-dependent hydrolase